MKLLILMFLFAFATAENDFAGNFLAKREPTFHANQSKAAVPYICGTHPIASPTEREVIEPSMLVLIGRLFQVFWIYIVGTVTIIILASVAVYFAVKAIKKRYHQDDKTEDVEIEEERLAEVV